MEVRTFSETKCGVCKYNFENYAYYVRIDSTYDPGGIPKEMLIPTLVIITFPHILKMNKDH